MTPVAGEALILTGAGAPVLVGVCGGAVCTVTTDAQGMVQSAVTATGAGAVALSAFGNAGSVTAAFSAVLPPGVLHAVSSSAGTLFLGGAGAPATTVFAVRVTIADGVTALAGKPVTFSTSAGAVVFGACGSPVCLVVTDAAGVASTTVTIPGAGPVSLLASADASSVAAAFTVAVRARSVKAARQVQYIAEGAMVIWTPGVVLADSSASVSQLPVIWTGAQGMTFAAATTVSGGDGLATGAVTAGPLRGGERAVGSACAWTNVCASLAVQGVAAGEWRIAAVGGAEQSVPNGSRPVAASLRVVNATGDPVAGVPVEIDQVVSEWQAACPESGRCPVAATMRSTREFATSDLDGMVSVTPAQVEGAPSVTRIAVIAGPAGFATMAVETHP
ncbi:MAG: hypothetical protein NVSMB3_07620 [Acidobacteriaceae bacterium]